jgi:lipopolysaccharide transport system ATP-binding protein
MSKIALKISKVSKLYRLGEIGTGTLGGDLKRWWSRMRGKEDPFAKIGEENDRTNLSDAKYVYALKDIDFEVPEGQVVGIIGRNGAGKSTLLKLLSRVTTPTDGEILANGRIASLLEVGTGFHPELTGRENLYLNGAILGMSKAEINSKLDEIVDFSGCRKYLDTPVKRYSSGMKVRLGFAVAAHLDPELLIVDEVLAVGDAEFQKKCIGKMQDVAGTGRTVLFVSHNMSSIRNLCERVIVLDMGKMIFDGNVEEGINHYLSLNSSEGGVSYKKHYNLKEKRFVSDISINESEAGIIEYLNNDIEINVKLQISEELIGAYLGIIIEDAQGNFLIVSSSDEMENDPIARLSEGKHELKVGFSKRILKPGKYYLSFSLRNNSGEIYHRTQRELCFYVEDNLSYRGMKNRYRTVALTGVDVQYVIEK